MSTYAYAYDPADVTATLNSRNF